MYQAKKLEISPTLSSFSKVVVTFQFSPSEISGVQSCHGSHMTDLRTPPDLHVCGSYPSSKIYMISTNQNIIFASPPLNSLTHLFFLLFLFFFLLLFYGCDFHLCHGTDGRLCLGLPWRLGDDVHRRLQQQDPSNERQQGVDHNKCTDFEAETVKSGDEERQRREGCVCSSGRCYQKRRRKEAFQSAQGKGHRFAFSGDYRVL